MQTATRSQILAVILAVLAGCASAARPPDAEPQTLQSAPAQTASTTPSDAPDPGPACTPLNGVCNRDTAAKADPCCPGTRCIEHSIYDYMRCAVPRPEGKFCYRHDQCASGTCQQGNCAR